MKRNLILVAAATIAAMLGVWSFFKRANEGETPPPAVKVTSPATDALERAPVTARHSRSAPGAATGDSGASRHESAAAARGVHTLRIDGPGDDAIALEPKGEVAVSGRSYAAPATLGERTVLTGGHRIGPSEIRLPEAVGEALGDRTAEVRAEVCVDATGAPEEVRIVEGTGVARVDEQVASVLLHSRYRAHTVDGRRVEFCERTTVVVAP